MQFLCKSVF